MASVVLFNRPLSILASLSEIMFKLQELATFIQLNHFVMKFMKDTFYPNKINVNSHIPKNIDHHHCENIILFFIPNCLNLFDHPSNCILIEPPSS